jgi:hypothetical protein
MVCVGLSLAPMSTCDFWALFSEPSPFCPSPDPAASDIPDVVGLVGEELPIIPDLTGNQIPPLVPDNRSHGPFLPAMQAESTEWDVPATGPGLDSLRMDEAMFQRPGTLPASERLVPIVRFFSYILIFISSNLSTKVDSLQSMVSERTLQHSTLTDDMNSICSSDNSKFMRLLVSDN